MNGTACRPAAVVLPQHRSPPHGFCDDEPTRRLLRSRPPRQALAWAAARLGGPVVSARALRGGMSSAVHLLTARTAEGSREAVLRRYVRPDLNTEEPDLVAREAQALGAAGFIDVPTPLLLAADPSGTEAGAPAVLMSRVPGRVDWWPSDLNTWLERLAGVLVRIHAAPLPPPGTLRRFAPYPQASYQPPGEIITVYPERHAVPNSLWLSLLQAADRNIDPLVYAGLHLPEANPAWPKEIQARCTDGAQARIAFGDPDSAEVRARGQEEGVGDGLAARINYALAWYQPVLTAPNLAVRFHAAVLYNSILRFDDQMLVNPHIHGMPAFRAPVLHLRRVQGGPLFETYLECFENIWAAARPYPAEDS